MSALSKFRKFINWPLALKLILLEALYYSILNEWHLKIRVYQAIKPLHINKPNTDQLSTEEIRIMIMVSKAMRLLEKYAVWHPKCYNRALTAKRMLTKRNIVTSMHIGFRKKENKFDGHAWLTYKGKIVTGFVQGIKEYKTLDGVDFLQNLYP